MSFIYNMNKEKKNLSSTLNLNIKKVNTDKAADEQMEEFLRKEQILLDNGKTHPMLVRHYTNTYWTYLCFPCNATCLSEIFLHSHLKGKKHSFQLLSKNVWPASIIENHPFYKKRPLSISERSADTVNQVIVAPGEPLPPGIEETESVIIKSILDENLDKHALACIGIEYMIEIIYCEYESKEPSYLCVLCTVKGDRNTIVKHIHGYRHRVRYLSIHYPLTSRALQKYYARRLLNVKLVERICKHIEDTYGRLPPIVITGEEFENNKNKYIDQITNGKHFTEQANGSLEEFVEKLYTELSTEMPELSSLDEKETWNQKSEGSEANLKKDSQPSKKNDKKSTDQKNDPGKINNEGSLSSLSDVTESDDDDLFIVLDSTDDSDKNKNIKNSGQLQRVRNKERENVAYRNRQENDKAMIAEKVKWAQYRVKMKEFQEEAQKKFELNEQFPEKHPSYQKEWKKFWNRKCRELQSENKDIMNIDLKPEWIEFWSKRMRQLHDESIEEQKKTILIELGLPSDEKPDKNIINSKRSDSLLDSGFSSVSRLTEKRLSIERQIKKIRSRISSEEKHKRSYDPSISRRSNERSMSGKSYERNVSRNYERSPRRSCDRDILRNRERSRSHDRNFYRNHERNLPRSLERNSSRRSIERNLSRKSPERNSSRKSNERNLSRKSPEHSMFRRSQERSVDRIRDKSNEMNRDRSNDRDKIQQNKMYRKRDRNFERDYDEKDTKYRRQRSPSPRKDQREFRPHLDMDMKRKWRLLDEKMGEFLSKYRKTYEDYLETPEKHPLYHNEWMKFKDSRNTFDDDEPSLKSEWEQVWQNKLKQFREEEIQTKKMSIMKEIGIDTKTSNDSRNRDRRNSPDRRGQDLQSKKFQQTPNDDLNLVIVLRHLTALENYLGSLGPKVVDMLGTVLKMEKEKPNSSENILLNDDNCVFLETVKEKLKGQLIADLIDSNAKSATKTAIQYVASLIYKAGKLADQNKKNSSSNISGMGSVDKAAIANQIANTLIAQGKTDVTTEELETLINAAIGMASSSNTSVTNSITSGGILNRLAEMRGEGQYANKNKRVPENDKRSNANNGSREEKSQDAPFMDKLSDADLKTLLQNFKDLSAEEQNGLISYLKKLESISPHRVEQLRKFIDLGSADDQINTRARDKEFSPFSSRKCGVNPASFDEKKNSVPINPSYNKTKDSDDDEDYNYDEVIKSAEEKVKERQFEEEMKIITQSIMDSNKLEMEKTAPVNEIKQPVENKTTEESFNSQSIVNVLNIVKNSSDMKNLLNSLAPTSTNMMINQQQVKQNMYPIDNNMQVFKDNNAQMFKDNSMHSFKDNNMPTTFNNMQAYQDNKPTTVNPNKSNLPSLLNLNVYSDIQHQNNMHMKMNPNPTLLPGSSTNFMSHQPPMMMAPVNKNPMLTRPQTMNEPYNNYNKSQFMPRPDSTPHLAPYHSDQMPPNENRGMPHKVMNQPPNNNNPYVNRGMVPAASNEMSQNFGANTNFPKRFPNQNAPQFPAPQMNQNWGGPRNQQNKNWSNDTAGGQFQYNTHFGDASTGMRNKFPVRGRGATRPYGNQGGRGGGSFKHN